MTYTIENDMIRVSVDDLGAEMCSMMLKKSGREYLWQADPTYWTGHAYNLFPICGRLTEGKYTYRGQTYEMNLHGFARKSTFERIAHTEDSISLRLSASEDTMKMYPFAFAFTLTYKLDGASVTTVFHVENQGEKEMIFAVGGHPGFNLPLEHGEVFEDYYLEFDCAATPRALVMSETCYYLNDTVPFPLEDDRILPLCHTLFDNDAIFLTEMCQAVTLKSHKSNRQVRVEYPDMKFLGLWHKPQTEAPYVCIEPWSGVPADDGVIDDLETKREMRRLASGCTFETAFRIAIQ